MLLQDSPVEKARKELHTGDCEWAGYEHVRDNLQIAAHHLASGKYTCCSDEHVQVMAILGCGHEETMKAEQMRCKMYHYC